MVWTIIKNSAADIWDEMLYLMIFNVIWSISLLLLVVWPVIGLLLIIPWPLITFGLFFTVYDIGEAKGIGFGTFWRHALSNWRQAYLWGVINLVVLFITWINLNFYRGVESEWAGLAQIFILILSLLWLILQVITLAFYPRLENPGLKLALRNAGVVIGRYPLLLFFLIILIGLILTISAFLPIVLFLGAFSIIAVAANRTVAAVVAKEKLREQEKREA